jgi:DNA-directed RNA polymerase specialized sigma24 family protein
MKSIQGVGPLVALDAMFVSAGETNGTPVEEAPPTANGHLKTEADPYRIAEQLAKAKTAGRHYRDDVLGDALLAVAQGATDRREIENAVRTSVRRERKYGDVHAPLSEADERQRVGPPERARLGISDEVNRLPLRQRQAVILVFWEGLTEQEAAVEMGCAQRVVHTHIDRAVRKLRKFFSPLYLKSGSSMPYVSEGEIRVGKSRPAKCGKKGRSAC